MPGEIPAVSKLDFCFSYRKPVENSLLDSSGIVSQLEAVVAASAEAKLLAPSLDDNSNAEPENNENQEGDAEGDVDGGEEDSEEEEDVSSWYFCNFYNVSCTICRLKLSWSPWLVLLTFGKLVRHMVPKWICIFSQTAAATTTSGTNYYYKCAGQKYVTFLYMACKDLRLSP